MAAPTSPSLILLCRALSPPFPPFLTPDDVIRGVLADTGAALAPVEARGDVWAFRASPSDAVLTLLGLPSLSVETSTDRITGEALICAVVFTVAPPAAAPPPVGILLEGVPASERSEAAMRRAFSVYGDVVDVLWCACPAPLPATGTPSFVFLCLRS